MPEFRQTAGAETDPGLFSLSQIMHLMRVEYGRSQRYRYPLVCMMVGVDRLAHLRDLYGYDSKETILDEVVRLLQSETRSCDFLGRLVDDRLLCVAPHTDPQGARALANRLLDGVRKLHFDGGGRPLQVTVSIGASHTTGEDTLFFDTLLAASESALAEAGKAGGDRYLHRDPSPHLR